MRKWTSKTEKSQENVKKISSLKVPELQFLKTLIFFRALWKLQNWVNFSFFFSDLKIFSLSIIKEMTRIVNVKPNWNKEWKKTEK